MLSSLLKLYVAYLVFGRLANTIFEMIRLKGELKLYRKSLVVYYVCLIGLDTIVYLTTKSLILLFLATIISWIISIIYMLYNLKIKFEIPDKNIYKSIIKYGIPYALERILSRIFLLFYGIIASNLGTEEYSIHTVCYSVCTSLEIITNAYQAALMIKVPKGKTYIEQYKKCIEMKNKCFFLITLLNFIFSIIYLLISHGSLPLNKCFPYIIFYSFGVFGLYPYETYKTLCIAQGKSIILLIGSIIGVIVRCTICAIFLKSSFALFVFGLSNYIDFYFRSIIYRYVLRKIENKIV